MGGWGKSHCVHAQDSSRALPLGDGGVRVAGTMSSAKCEPLRALARSGAGPLDSGQKPGVCRLKT